MRGWRRPVATALVPVLLALAGNLATNTVDVDEVWWVPAVWAVTIVLAFVTVGLAVRPSARPPAVAPGGDLDEACDWLARALRDRYVQAEEQRRVHTPPVLTVRVRPAHAGLFDSWANVRLAPLGSGPGPLKLNGKMPEIARLYGRIPSGRLAEDHPQLAPGVAAQLVGAGKIRPLLDGFDDIAEGRRRPAIEQLNVATAVPVVLTSRPREYAAAVAGGPVLSGAAGIRAYLLGQLIPAVYPEPPAARRWFAFLSGHCDRRRTGDVAWWQLRERVPRALRVAVFGAVHGAAAFLTLLLFQQLFVHFSDQGRAAVGPILAASGLLALIGGFTTGWAAGVGGIFAAFGGSAVGLIAAGVAVPACLAYVLTSTAWGEWCLITRPYLAVTGRLPWRAVRFLESARERGVLRQSGAVYRFRHDELARAR
ncbi:hypothetical protein ACFY36_13270 [Actinoplanes sp. NPDC000266]